jgi:hypothetical protein
MNPAFQSRVIFKFERVTLESLPKLAELLKLANNPPAICRNQNPVLGRDALPAMLYVT